MVPDLAGSVVGLSSTSPLVAQATTVKQTSPPAHGPQESDKRDYAEGDLRLLWRSLDGVPYSKENCNDRDGHWVTGMFRYFGYYCPSSC